MTMLCDTGACKTVLIKKPPKVKFSNDTLIVKSASGHVSTKSLTEPLLLSHEDSGRSCKNQCIYDPSCPVNLLGRDVLEKLEIGVLPGPEGMYAKLMLNEKQSPADYQINVCQGLGEPHYYYWTLDLPSLEPLQHIANRYLPTHSTRQDYTQYHNTLRFKQSPGPNPVYDQEVHKLGPQMLTLQHLYVTQSGNAVCSVLQPEAVQRVNRMPNPHVSVAHNDSTEWKDLGRILTQVERDRYEKTEDTHEGWLQGRRTGCMRYTLGWVITTHPATYMTDSTDLHVQEDSEN